MTDKKYTLGIDIGSTTVKIAILDEENQLLFADYERHFANIQETLAHLLGEAHEKLGELTLQPVITGSGGLALANHSLRRPTLPSSSAVRMPRSSILKAPMWSSV